MAKVLAIGDPHAPVVHPGYLSFCLDIKEKYDCDVDLCIGDIIDHHAISFHAAHPSCPGPNDEFEQTYFHLRPWVAAFPKLKTCIGNHCERVIRLAESVNIPKRYLRDHADVWDTPDWEWAHEFEIDDVHYFHGTGTGGMHPAFNTAKTMGMSVVQGHVHTAHGIKWLANPNKRWFGMDTGCGIDDRAAAMAYGRHFKRRSILGCGVVIDGVPYTEVMPCGRGEKYDRHKFTVRPKKRKKV